MCLCCIFVRPPTVLVWEFAACYTMFSYQDKVAMDLMNAGYGPQMSLLSSASARRQENREPETGFGALMSMASANSSGRSSSGSSSRSAPSGLEDNDAWQMLCAMSEARLDA